MIFSPPPYDPQSSTIGDSDSCQTQATLHCIEMLQGNAQRWSPRAIATLAGIKPGVGGSIQQVLDAINEYGLIPYDLWPDLTGAWTDAEYYTPIPKNILAQANKSFVVAYAAANLDKTPLLVEVAVSPQMNHLVAQFDATQVFDSYQPDIKPLTTWQSSAIVGKWGLSLKPKNMTLGFQVAGNPTVYIQAGNSLVPLADWQAFLNLGGSTGSIVPLTQTQLDSLSVVASDLFKTNS